MEQTEVNIFCLHLFVKGKHQFYMYFDTNMRPLKQIWFID